MAGAGVAGAFSPARLTTLGLTGAGAVAAGFLQASNLIPVASPNTRDLVLGAVAAVLAAQGGPMLRPLALGLGAVAVGSLITRTVLSGQLGG
jgi:hypothetical protein